MQSVSRCRGPGIDHVQVARERQRDNVAATPNVADLLIQKNVTTIVTNLPRLDNLLRFNVPQLDFRVCATCSELLGISGERYGVHARTVREGCAGRMLGICVREGAFVFACRAVVQEHLAVAASRREQ